jgi:uncharacterized membrane protein YGL010W
MRTLDEWFSEYGESHQNHTNKMIHWVCVPLIFYSFLGLLWSIPFDFIANKFPTSIQPFVTPGMIVSIIVLIFYLRLSVPIFWGILVMITIGVIVCYTIRMYSSIPLWAISLVVFVIAWIGQFYGHKVEGKKPSFLKDVQFLLIGPAWVIAFLYRKLNIHY